MNSSVTSKQFDIFHEHFLQVQPQWADMDQSDEISQRISIEVLQPREDTSVSSYYAPNAELCNVINAQRGLYSGGGGGDYEYYNEANNYHMNQDDGYYAEDSDLEYEMMTRPNYCKYCERNLTASNDDDDDYNDADDDDDDDNGDEPVFVDMERMPAINVSFVRNICPMRYSECDAENDGDADGDADADADEEHDMYNQFENKLSSLADDSLHYIHNKQNVKEKLEMEQKKPIKEPGKRIPKTLPKTVKKSAVAQKVNKTKSVARVVGGSQEKKPKQLNKPRQNVAKKVNSNKKASNATVKAPAPAAAAAKPPTQAAKHPTQAATRIKTTQQGNRKPIKRQKQTSAVATNTNLEAQQLLEQAKTLMDECAGACTMVQTKAIGLQAADKDVALRKRKTKPIVCTKSMENLKLNRLSLYNRMAMIQERIIQSMDLLRCCLLDIHVPKRIYKKPRLERKAFKFCVRFSRNYLDPLKDMIDKFRFISPEVFNSAVSNDGCRRLYNIFALIFKSLRISEHFVHYFLFDQVSQKLSAFIELVYLMTTICLEKSLFDRQDTIIECMQERCTKFLGFIEDMQEERFMLAREDNRRQFEKQNQTHPNYELKMCMNDFNMYEPKLVRKPQIPKPKRTVRRLPRSLVVPPPQNEEVLPQQQIQSEPDTVESLDNIKTRIEEYADEGSQLQLVELQQDQQQEFDYGKGGTQRQRGEGEGDLKPLNAALMEALQQVTKNQLRQVLEPLIKSCQ